MDNHVLCMLPKTKTGHWCGRMNRQLAFVLLDQPVVIDMHAVAHTIRMRYPDLSVDIVPASANTQDATQSPLIVCDGELIAFMNVATPLPNESNEIWARAARTWPQVSAV